MTHAGERTEGWVNYTQSECRVPSVSLKLAARCSNVRAPLARMRWHVSERHEILADTSSTLGSLPPAVDKPDGTMSRVRFSHLIEGLCERCYFSSEHFSARQATHTRQIIRAFHIV